MVLISLTYLLKEYDEEEDLKDGGAERRSSGTRLSYDNGPLKPSEEYECLDMNDLFEAQQKLIVDVSSVLNVDNDKASVLLLNFGWNKERLLESYIADPEGTLKEAGALHKKTSNPKTSSKTDLVECSILLEKFPLNGKNQN